MRSCPHCGEVAADGARFCVNCGTPLPAATDPVADAPPEADEPPTEESPRDEATPPAAGDDDPTDLSMPVAGSDETTEVSLTTCHECGAANTVRRSRCGRCGAPLHDGAPTAVSGRATVGDDDPTPPPAEAPPPVAASAGRGATPPAATPAPAPEAPGRRRRGWLIGLVVVVIGVLAGTALGVAAGLGLGPFDTATDLPVFAPASYVDDPQALRPAFAGASSQRPAGDSRTFGPELTADGNLSTAWITEGTAVGERLRHTFEQPVWITAITIANGDQATGSFSEHGRLQEATVDLGHGQRITITFQDTPGEQQVTLPSPRITDEVTWTVTEVVGGEDLALSEVRYSGYPATEEDRAAYPGD